MTRFAAPIAEQIWDQKYRLKEADGTPIDETVEVTWRRIAKALAQAEAKQSRSLYEDQFYDALDDFKFIPAGRIVAGAGSGRNVTLQNCYVLGTIPDSMGGIFDALKDAALTMQMGGGIGHDFSTLRPKGALVKGVAADASGPLTFMDCWDSMCRTVMSAGSRRGAMMGTMRCDHPDIEDFIAAKKDPSKLRMFNLSVLATDAFMQAVKNDLDFDLVFGGKVYRTVRARDLWDKIMRSTYAQAEPGVIFIDRINEMNPLNYCERIAATNPCGEEPLPPYGACLLGSVNLVKFILDPFTEKARLDAPALTKVVRTAVRMMDNVIDVTQYPLPQQAEESNNKRRLGLGFTGLADALIMLGMTYGSPEAVIWAEVVMRNIAHASYLASADLAEEKGAFPLFDRDEYLNHPYVQQFDPDVQDAIAAKGLRNSHLTSIAPTGTISLMAGNVSSGIEPLFAYHYTRKVLEKDGSRREERVEDYAYAMYRQMCESPAEPHGYGKPRFDETVLPDYFVSAQTLPPEAHVRMQAAAQKWVDSSISKTINCPDDITFESFKGIYQMAYDLGCKGCTTYRPNDITGSVLSVEPKKAQPPTEALAALDLMKREVEVVTGIKSVAEALQQHPDSLAAEVYKLKWPNSEHALYVTISDILRDGAWHPYAVFINTKDPEHYAWIMALTRMISAVFRRGGDTRFVAEELKSVFDPRGGAWVGGKYINSMIAMIGGTIEHHMQTMQERHLSAVTSVSVGAEFDWAGTDAETVADAVRKPAQIPNPPFMMIVPKGKNCPSCGSGNVKNEAGCFQCLDCGHSKCG